MSWKERFSSKMDRTSWKTAHDDSHPHVEDMDDLQAHLMSHHSGDFLGDLDDHEWYHLDPNGYNDFHHEHNWPIEDNQPDHYHTYDYGHLGVPNELPKSFASKIAHNDLHPWPNNREELLNHFQSHHENAISNNGSGWSRARLLQFMHDNPDIGLQGHTYIHKEARKYMGPEDHEHDDDFNVDVPNEVPADLISKVTVSFKKLADPGSLRSEGIPAFISPYQDDQDEDDQVVGPQDLDSNATTVDKFPKSVGVFKNSSWITANGGSQFGEPIDYGENRLQDVEDISRLQSRFPLDTGKRNYSEQRADANPLTLRSWFTGDDVNGPWPHTKNLSGPLDFEPTDDQNEDSTGPVMSSFQERYAHFDDIVHPFPDEDSIRDHLSTHHFGENPVGDIYLRQSFQERPPLTNNELVREHLNFHYHDALNKNPLIGKPGWVLDHNHDDDPKVNVPDDLAKLASLNITSSWHEAFVETFDTHPDEDTPDSLLNPADELKNGRPRANDLPNQSAQLIPGMLIDHDQMGGSGTASGSF